jgi:hypothetical protein
MVTAFSVCFHDFPQYRVQGLIGTFRQVIPLRIIHRTPPMDHYIMLHESAHYVIHEMCALVAHELYGASVMTPYILVKKFTGGRRRIVP